MYLILDKETKQVVKQTGEFFYYTAEHKDASRM